MWEKILTICLIHTQHAKHLFYSIFFKAQKSGQLKKKYPTLLVILYEEILLNMNYYTEICQGQDKHKEVSTILQLPKCKNNKYTNCCSTKKLYKPFYMLLVFIA